MRIKKENEKMSDNEFVLSDDMTPQEQKERILERISRLEESGKEYYMMTSGVVNELIYNEIQRLKEKYDSIEG